MATLAVQNNNPGNLKDPSTGGFKQFSSPQEGYAALLNDLQSKQTGTTSTGLGPSSTLVDFASKYAPGTDNNNVGQYAANLANKIGVRPDTQLKDLDLGKWAAAVANNEDSSSLFGQQSFNPKPYSQPTANSPVFPTVTQDIPKSTDTDNAFNTGLTNIASGNSQANIDKGIGAGKGLLQVIRDTSGVDSNPVVKGMLGNAPTFSQDVDIEKQAIQPSNLMQKQGAQMSEALPNILPVGQGIEGAKTVGGLIGKGLTGEKDAVLTAISPRLTPSVAGETSTKTVGLLKKIIPVTTKKLQQVADAVRPYFNPKVSWSENAQVADKAIADLANQTETHIAQNNVIRPIKEIAAKIRDADEPISLKGTPFENQITPLKNAFIKIMRGNGGDLSGEFQSLRDFDNYVDKTYPTLWDRENAPMRNAVTVLRNTVKDDIASHLPKDSPYRDLLNQQSNLFDARDTFREKAAKGELQQQGEIGTNALQRFSQRHPTISSTIKKGSGLIATGLVGGEVAGHAINSK